MDIQLDRLRRLLTDTLPANRFYARKFAGISPADLRTPADFARLPFTTKADLAADQADHPPYGSTLARPPADYCRLHQTSGTSTGRPLRWLDTPESWDWLLRCWQISFPIMGLKRGDPSRPSAGEKDATPDRLFFPFSFGPFLGFWSAFEAAARAGFLCVPGGGMTSTARLRFLIEHRFTVVFATPTYALHLAELAAKEGLDLTESAVRAVVVAGEPGGSIPATRRRIEEVWGARVFDHYGMTEIGPVAVEAEATPSSLVVLGSEYIAEVLAPGTAEPVSAGDLGELVVTNLGRAGSPLIRYRTGDLVRAARDPAPPGVPDWLRLEGGVVGRADDMIHVRGNNLYPTAIEAIVRRFPGVTEFRIVIDAAGPLPDLRLDVEPAATAGPELADAVARAIRDELLFRVDVTAVPPGTLPRFELKARRVVRVPAEGSGGRKK